MKHDHLSRVVIIDVEATCWSSEADQGSKPNEIIEIGACELDVRAGVISNPLSIVVKPRFSEVSPFCTELTGWTQEGVDEGVDIVDALHRLQCELHLTPGDIWFSCGQYDRKKLAPYGAGSIGALYGISAANNPFTKMQHFNVKTLFALKHRLRREFGMDRMLSHLGLELEGRHHSGVDDALNIAHIVKHVIG